MNTRIKPSEDISQNPCRDSPQKTTNCKNRDGNVHLQRRKSDVSVVERLPYDLHSITTEREGVEDMFKNRF